MAKKKKKAGGWTWVQTSWDRIVIIDADGHNVAGIVAESNTTGRRAIGQLEMDNADTIITAVNVLKYGGKHAK